MYFREWNEGCWLTLQIEFYYIVSRALLFGIRL